MTGTPPHQPSGDGFATTRWSLVAAAGEAESEHGRQALAALCHGYWLPLYAYVRRRTPDEHEAQDLTQGFFARFLERNDFAAARRDRGRFRAYLLTSLKHFLANEWDRARALKRGGGQAPLPLDFGDGERRLLDEPDDPTTPEQAYERQWVRTVLDVATRRLRDEFIAQAADPARQAERRTRFEALLPHLAGTLPRGSVADTARQLGLGEGAVRTAALRLRDRYGAILRNEIAQTLCDPSGVDDEIAALFAAVRPAPRIL